MAQSCTLSAFLVAGLVLSSCGGQDEPGGSNAPQTSAGGSAAGGTSTGGVAGTSTGGVAGTSTGGSSGADGGSGNLGPGCAGYGGVGGTPPHCHDGVIESAQHTPRGFCYASKECTGATPFCDAYAVECLACPTGMVSVGDSCVDPNEVTRADYAAWLASAPTVGQGAECTWNTSFAPDSACMAKPEVCQGACDSHPQVCVDWCDAAAYCEAKGQRLCGWYSNGQYTGPTIGSDTWLSPDATELGEACNAYNYDSYPYGSSYVPGTCNDSEGGLGTTVPVASKPGCAHAHPAGKIYDVTGNVREWQKACSAAGNASDDCRLRSGGFLHSGQSAPCWKVDENVKRDTHAVDIGFRCCKS